MALKKMNAEILCLLIQHPTFVKSPTPLVVKPLFTETLSDNRFPSWSFFETKNHEYESNFNNKSLDLLMKSLTKIVPRIDLKPNKIPEIMQGLAFFGAIGPYASMKEENPGSAFLQTMLHFFKDQWSTNGESKIQRMKAAYEYFVR